MIPRVFLVTPFAEKGPLIYGPGVWLKRPNVIFAQRCMADCIRVGEAPYASHLLYTQPNILDDFLPEERACGLVAGRRFLAVCEYAVCYVDRGFSTGMRGDLEAAVQYRTEILFRRLEGPALVSNAFLHQHNVPHHSCRICVAEGR
jgi:hypothetical protein